MTCKWVYGHIDPLYPKIFMRHQRGINGKGLLYSDGRNSAASRFAHYLLTSTCFIFLQTSPGESSLERFLTPELMPYAGWGECRWSADPNDDRPVHTQERFHDTLGTAMTLAIALRAGGLHPSRTHPLFWSSGRRHLLRDRWLRHEQRSKGFPSKTIGLSPPVLVWCLPPKHA